MDWVEPLAKWGVLAIALFSGFALQRKRAEKKGEKDEQLKQMKEGERAQDLQLQEMLLAGKRDLLDELKRLRDRKNRR